MNWIFTYLIVSSNLYLSHSLNLVIETSTGYIRGKLLNITYDTNSRDTINVIAFLGIPYAEPPIGINRFKPPLKKQPWVTTLNAYDVSPFCPQIDPKFGINYFQEDCLYLNIYVPESNSPKTTIVYFHGGSYEVGSSNMWPPYVYAKEDVIFITVNYRLGLLGFFTTGDEHAYANNGIRDQILALEWINANIKSFGGDPTLISIMGESAGASSVNIHHFSPLSGSRGLFRSVIMMSGTVMSPWAIYNTPAVSLAISRFIALRSGCFPTSQNNGLNDDTLYFPNDNIPLEMYITLFVQRYGTLNNSPLRHDAIVRAQNAKLVECMQQRSVNDLLYTSHKLYPNLQDANFESYFQYLRPIWGPVIDGSFHYPDNYIQPVLPVEPIHQLIKGTLPRLSYFVGMTQNEYSTISEPVIQKFSTALDRALQDGSDGKKLIILFADVIRDYVRAQNITLSLNQDPKSNIPLNDFSSFPFNNMRHHDNALILQDLYQGLIKNELITRIIFYHYTSTLSPSKNLKDQIRDTLIEMLTDHQFVAPIHRFVRYYTDMLNMNNGHISEHVNIQHSAKVFMYLFDYRPQYSKHAKWKGAGHGSDLPYFMGAPFLNQHDFPRNYEFSEVSQWTETDRYLSSFLIKSIANFVKFGHPTPESPSGMPLNVNTLMSIESNNNHSLTFYPMYALMGTTNNYLLQNPEMGPLSYNIPPSISANNHPFTYSDQQNYLRYFNTHKAFKWPGLPNIHNVANKMEYVYIGNFEPSTTEKLIMSNDLSNNKPELNVKFATYVAKINENYRTYYAAVWNDIIPSLVRDRDDIFTQTLFKPSMGDAENSHLLMALLTTGGQFRSTDHPCSTILNIYKVATFALLAICLCLFTVVFVLFLCPKMLELARRDYHTKSYTEDNIDVNDLPNITQSTIDDIQFSSNSTHEKINSVNGKIRSNTSNKRYDESKNTQNANHSKPFTRMSDREISAKQFNVNNMRKGDNFNGSTTPSSPVKSVDDYHNRTHTTMSTLNSETYYSNDENLEEPIELQSNRGTDCEINYPHYITSTMKNSAGTTPQKQRNLAPICNMSEPL